MQKFLEELNYPYGRLTESSAHFLASFLPPLPLPHLISFQVFVAHRRAAPRAFEFRARRAAHEREWDNFVI